MYARNHGSKCVDNFFSSTPIHKKITVKLVTYTILLACMLIHTSEFKLKL